LRTILIVTVAYPPQPLVGALRPAGLEKYLPEFGWKCLVLTPAYENREPASNVIETPYRDNLEMWKSRLRLKSNFSLHKQLNVSPETVSGRQSLPSKVITFTRNLMGGFPDDRGGWLPFAISAAMPVIEEKKIDAILSTALPMTCHRIAARLQDKAKVPWIADYRDLWNVDQNTLENRAGLLGVLHRLYEKRLLSKASAITSVSSIMAEELAKYERPVESIENGFDEQSYPAPQPTPDALFTIVHTGQLYSGRRNPRILFEGIAELISEQSINRSRVRVRFYGPTTGFEISMIAELQLEDVVEFCGVKPRPECLEIQRRAQILLLLTWSTATTAWVIPAKMFEYLGSRRPILMVGGAREGAANAILKETNAGKFVEEKDALKRFLMDAYLQFESTGEVSYEGSADRVLQYSQRNMARRFAKLLDKVTAK
jgi:glycosyltransferase involved in cell wall biosynthesis